MKKFLALLLTVVLTATAAIAGTLAYLQSEDSDVNVMTLGNVKIEQHEYERVVDEDGNYEMFTSEKYGEGYAIQEFTQAKPLYPATGAITGWGTKVPFDQIEGASGTQAVFEGLNNVQDKFVLVENTGKSDAYVRTIIALEYGSNTKDLIGISIGDFWTWNDLGIMEIDGNNYYVSEAIYTGSSTRHVGGILPAGEYTYNSLAQIYLKNEATNEDVEAIDGNGNGTYDILVLSQAIQADGFDSAASALETAFPKGENNVNVPEWFEGVEIPRAIYCYEDYLDVRGADGFHVIGADFTTQDYMYFGPATKVELDLNGKTLTAGDHDNLFVAQKEGGRLTLSGAGTVNMGSSQCFISSKAETVINGGTYNMSNTNNKGHMYVQNSGKLIINDGKFITSDSDTPIAYCINGFIEINGGFFQNTSNNKAALLGMGNNLAYVNNQKITLRGGTFVNWNPMSSAFARPWDNPKVPALIVLADGYKVISETQDNGDTWYTVVAE